MENIVLTMPIKPQNKTNVGMMIAPTIMNYIGEALNIKKVLSTNTLNSYNEKDSLLDDYISVVERNGINYDVMFNDKANADRIVTVIQKMVDDQIIKISHEEIVRCDCGKVDILKSAIRHFSDGKIYKRDENGKYYCKLCNCECKTYNEDVLTIDIDLDNSNSKIEIVPIFLKKEIKSFEKSFNKSKILISKKRNTGYCIETNGKNHYIDIDFMWMNYVKLFSEDKKILIASNHQLLKMFIMNYINNISSNQRLTFVAHPYISDVEGINQQEEYDKCTDEFYKKLFILYNLKWNKKTSGYSESVIKYLSNISNTRRENIYKAIIELSQNTSNFDELDNYINKMIIDSVNMQENIIYVKKYVKKRD